MHKWSSVGCLVVMLESILIWGGGGEDIEARAIGTCAATHLKRSLHLELLGPRAEHFPRRVQLNKVNCLLRTGDDFLCHRDVLPSLMNWRQFLERL